MGDERLIRVQTFLPLKECAALDREAAARQLTRSSCTRRILESHLEHQRELAGATDHPEVAGAAATNILSALRELEERVAATVQGLGDEVAGLAEAVQLLMAMVDRVYFGLMVHLPEVPPDQRAGAIASAERRHLQWRRHVRALDEVGGPEAEIRYEHPAREPAEAGHEAA